MGKSKDRLRECSCNECGIVFHTFISRIKIGRGKFCSKKCHSSNMLKDNVCTICKQTFKKVQKRKLLFCSPSCREFSGIDEFRKDNLRKNRQSPAKGVARPEISKEKHWNWQGGLSLLNDRHDSNDYKIWRRLVWERDGFECQICGKRGRDLNANHIKKWSTHKELRFEISNGITLCKYCHVRLVTGIEQEWESYFNFNLFNKFVAGK